MERVRRHNHELVLAGGALLADGWGVEPAAPPAMTGSILALPCPVEVEPTKEACDALRLRWWREHRVEAMAVAFAGRAWVRISAQIYNELADYQRLLEITR